MGIFVPVVVDADHWDAETTSRRVVFIRVGRLCRRVHWTTGTMRDLQVLVCREFGAPEDLVHVRAKQNDSNPFILFHSESGKGHVDAAPLVWPDADLRDGSVVSVRDPLWQAVLALCAGEGDAARSRRSTKRADQNLPPLTPTAAPFSKAAREAAFSEASENAANEKDSETGAAGVDDVSESDFSAGSSRGVQDAKRSVGTNAESTRRQAWYLMPFAGALSALSNKQSGATSRSTSRRVHVARGDMPRRLAKTLAQRASVLSNLDDLTTRERVDVLLNDPGSSPAAATIGAAMITLILASTVTFCVETLPWFYEPEPSFASDPFLAIEASCIATFTAELSLRFWATDDRNGFFKRGMNVVDLVAIVPFYVDLIARGLSFPGLSVLRALRLARVFRLLRVSKTAVDLLGRTMSRSARPLYILGFLLMMALVTFAAVLYFAERGEYNETLGLWMRTTGFECDVPCDARTYDFTPAFLACGDDALIADATETVVSAYFDRHVPSVSSVGATCERVVEQSPFQSILHAVWWAVATMGTVGYGDIAPRTLAGWILASLAQMMGILVIALPITVIGSNFSAIYSSIGTSQSLCAKEHEPSAAAKPRRLHASGSGATAAKLTDGGMVGPLQHEWDLDVAFDELLPCAAPALVANGNDGANDPGGDARDSPRASLRSSRSRLGPANSWQMTRRSLTPEQQIEAFLKGEDLHENPRSPRAAGGSPTPVDPGVGAELDGSRENEKSRLGVRDLSAALREAKDEKDKKDKKGKGGSEKSRKAYVSAGSVPDRPRFEPPKVSRKSGRARRAALCALAEAFLADCVRNPEVRDKFAATRQRESLKKGDSLFIAGDAEKRGARTNGTGPKSRASLERKVGETDVSSVARQKSLRVPKTPQPTPGVSFATPRTEEDE